MNKVIIILAVLLVLLILSQLYFIMAKTETQPYEVIQTEKDFEIRHYPPATMASISMQATTYKELSGPGFRKLASYIFGGNDSKTSIAMTSPVHMDINDSASTMQFVMPANYTKSNLPQPDDSNVTITTTPDEYVAAIEFGGFASDVEIKSNSEKLAAALQDKSIEYYGNFRFLGYNAPYQLVGRRNEIIINVRWKK